MTELCTNNRQETKDIDTLADIMDVIAFRPASGDNSATNTADSQLSRLRTTAHKICAFLDKPADQIRLCELVEKDDDLVAFLERQDIGHQSAVQCVCDKNKILLRADELGWTSKAYALRKAWLPVRKAIRGKAPGAASIVEFAIELGKVPANFNPNDWAAWRTSASKRGLAPLTVDIIEAKFRAAMRNAGLTRLFPNLDLKSRKASTYALPLSAMHRNLRSEIARIHRWKTAAGIVAGRNSRFRVRPVTGEKLVSDLRALIGFVVVVRGKKGVKSLRQIVTKDNVCAYIEWLADERGYGRNAILSRLTGIHGLTVQRYPLFRRGSFAWFANALRRIPFESLEALRVRKDRRCAPYEVLWQVPKTLAAHREQATHLSPMDRAWALHDELLITFLLLLPWRQRNIRTCGIQPPAAVNIFTAELPTTVKSSPFLPKWAKEALHNNPNQTFLQFSFVESETKTRQAVRGVVPCELIKPLEMYLEHRHHLIVSEKDPGTLFLNRSQKAMRAKDVTNLVATLTFKHIGRRITPHLFRDIYAEHFLDSGGTLEELQQHLWHRSLMTTWRYCRRFNASHGAVAIDEHFSLVNQ